MASIRTWNPERMNCSLFPAPVALTFARVIGLPSEEDWPADSPISYCTHWGLRRPGTKLLHNLDPDENHLLSVS